MPDMTEALEHGAWHPESRFDTGRMAATFAPGFFDFGRSDRRDSHEDLLVTPGAPSEAQLHDQTIPPLSATVAP